MNRRSLNCIVSGFALFMVFVLQISAQPNDWRNVETGNPIYADGYIDQPYVVALTDGSWLVVFTTGAGEEGHPGQHIVALRSTDHGKTWSVPVKIEKPGTESASWAMPYITDYGRVYVFYVYNGDKVHNMGSYRNIREDMLGWYCFRYSDDNGKTWSERHRLPVRLTDVDRNNDWKGDVQIFWGIGKPIGIENGMMFAFTKIGTYMLEDSEGWFFFSDNINYERNPERLNWVLLPEGEKGLKNKNLGTIHAEQNIIQLSSGAIYCMHRTIAGHPAESYSHDLGKTWTLPAIPKYYDGRKIKNPRACPRIWKCENGKYLFWHHFNGGWDFENRNPVWISGGIEKNGRVIWTQPEILLYEKTTAASSQTYMVTIVTETGPEIRYYEGNVAPRLSYPDLIEQDGRFWFTQTNKEIGRVHEVPATFLEKLWSQFLIQEICKEGLVFEADQTVIRTGNQFEVPLEQYIPGFTIDLVYILTDLQPGNEILRLNDQTGKQVLLTTEEFGAVGLTIKNGSDEQKFYSDPGIVKAFGDNSVSVIFDDASKIVQFVINGIVNDGGNYRQFGWGTYEGDLNWSGHSVLTTSQFRTAPNAHESRLKSIRLYDRPLLNTEIIGNHRANALVFDISCREVFQ